MSVVRKCLSTVWPKLPVPPVIRRVLSLKMVLAIKASLLFLRRDANLLYNLSYFNTFLRV